MVRNVINNLTGEILDIAKVQPVTIVSHDTIKFKTNYTDNTVDGDAEVNSGDYIVDDSQYIDFKKLLARSSQCTKQDFDFLSSIPVVDNVGGVEEKELDDIINASDMLVSVDKSDELSTSDAKTQTEVGASNPVDNTPDVSDKSETNG